ncbi:hypothetical protein VTO42DRAFT_2174 [Malbranchea cinnamomea]
MAEMTGKESLPGLAEQISGQAYLLSHLLKKDSTVGPSLASSAPTEQHTSNAIDIEKVKENIFGLTKKLARLLHGPRSYLHEYVGSNWEHGALYAVLEFNVLENIPLDGEAHVSQLAAKSGILEDKLLKILRLIACEQIVEETSERMFRHTDISTELVQDKDFKAFIGFQLFETRVASAHLADALRREKEYWKEMSAFNYSWGAPMYEWHRAHPEKGSRFESAMRSVTETLDPGNKLFDDWFKANQVDETKLIVHVGGHDSQTAELLVKNFPTLRFEIQNDSPRALEKGQKELTPELSERITFVRRDIFKPRPVSEAEYVGVYLLRNVLWKMDDKDCIKLLQSFVPVLEKSNQVFLLVNEVLSPAPRTFEPHVEQAYRRRDVTLMTMHNAKQRTEQEWRDLITGVNPHFKVDVVKGYTSHSSRGLWTVRWDARSS